MDDRVERIESCLMDIACDPDHKEVIKAAQMLLAKYDPDGYAKKSVNEKKDDDAETVGGDYSVDKLLDKLK